MPAFDGFVNWSWTENGRTSGETAGAQPDGEQTVTPVALARLAFELRESRARYTGAEIADPLEFTRVTFWVNRCVPELYAKPPRVIVIPAVTLPAQDVPDGIAKEIASALFRAGALKLHSICCPLQWRLRPARTLRATIVCFGLWRSLASALAWGARGPGFKSRQPDQPLQYFACGF
jgi:hypothetical protein